MGARQVPKEQECRHLAPRHRHHSSNHTGLLLQRIQKNFTKKEGGQKIGEAYYGKSERKPDAALLKQFVECAAIIIRLASREIED